MPILTDGLIATPVVGIPHRQGSLKPLDVARSLVVAGVWAVAADTGAPAVLEAVVWLDIPGEDPCLEHGPGLAVGRSLAETGNDANDRRAIEGGDPLPQDPAVGVDCHRLKRLAKRREKELNSPARCRQINHAHNLRQMSTNPIQIANTYRSELSVTAV